MDIREIVDLKNATLFVPFVVLMADGREFEARQPRFHRSIAHGAECRVVRRRGRPYPERQVHRRAPASRTVVTTRVVRISHKRAECPCRPGSGPRLRWGKLGIPS